MKNEEFTKLALIGAFCVGAYAAQREQFEELIAIKREQAEYLDEHYKVIDGMIYYIDENGFAHTDEFLRSLSNPQIYRPV